HDRANNTMRRHILETPEPSNSPPVQAPAALPVEDGPAGWVWQNQQPLIVSNLAEETRWPRFLELMKRLELHSICDLPLSTARQRLGALAFLSRQVAAYDSADLDFLQLVANQVALAVENALAFECIEKLKERLTQEKVYLEEEIRTEHNFDEIVGESTALRRVLKEVETVAPTQPPLLIRQHPAP